jgi:ribosomal 50S subunit-recycling heat shock protein
MKTKILFVFLVLSLLVASAEAQNYVFKVLGAKGRITVNNLPVKVGSQVAANQVIKIVGTNAYLNLSHKSLKRVIELTQPGAYKVQELENQIKSSNEASLEDKYYDWVADKIMNDKDVKVSSRTRFRHMNKTGSVVRGQNSVITSLVLKDNKSYILGDKCLIRWELIDGEHVQKDLSGYKVIFYNIAEDVIHEQVVTQEVIEVDFSQGKLAQEDKFLMKIIPLNKNGEYMISPRSIDGEVLAKIDEQKQKEIMQILNKIRQGKNSNTAFGKLIEARFLEENELYGEAMYAYENALKLSFEAEAYSKLYDYFYERTFVKKEGDKSDN